MCRIALLHNCPEGFIELASTLQANGANRPPRVWRSGPLALIDSRFDVTTEEFTDAVFPLKDDRFVLQYNGEVFGMGREAFADQRVYTSDVHYCLKALRDNGIGGFLRDVDFQGTFHIHDLLSNQTFVIVDQLNTTGCFYGVYHDSIIVAQEYTIVDQLLRRLGASADVPIHMLGNGTYLKIDANGSLTPVEYRPHWRQVYGGGETSVEAFSERVEELTVAVREATIRRLPRTGTIGVLTGGGVDSGLLLALVASHLRRQGELDRLRVFTFGRPDFGSTAEDNDLLTTLDLIAALHLSPQQHFVRLEESQETRAALYQAEVFCDSPRLITPNPILNTQVRHTVRMSVVLADMVRLYPDLKVVLTGDVADELFAGYHSMRVGVGSSLELAQRVRDKLSDLPLNDSARYTLASMYGCSEVVRRDLAAMIPLDQRNGVAALTAPAMLEVARRMDFATPQFREKLTSLHPVEIRTPFSSHIVLRALRDASADFLVGRYGSKPVSKFLLRVAARRIGVPDIVAARRKIPFNEGGSGVRNAERDELEHQVAREWRRHSAETLRDLLEEDYDTLVRLGVVMRGAAISDQLVSDSYEQLAVYAAAKSCGFSRLLRGNAFRAQMPDCVYSTSESQSAYEPSSMLTYSPETDRVGQKQ